MKSYTVTIAYISTSPATNNCQRVTFSLYTSSVADAIEAARQRILAAGGKPLSVQVQA